MDYLRKENDYQLNKASRGKTNVSDQANDRSLIGTARMRVSRWLDPTTVGQLILCSKLEFMERCEELLKEN